AASPDLWNRDRMTRLATGIEGFDAMVQGGLPVGSSVILQGPPGQEKLRFALTFLAEGLKSGGSGLVVSSQSPDAVLPDLRGPGPARRDRNALARDERVRGHPSLFVRPEREEEVRPPRVHEPRPPGEGHARRARDHDTPPAIRRRHRGGAHPDGRSDLPEGRRPSPQGHRSGPDVPDPRDDGIRDAG